MHSLADIALSWGPILLLIGVGIYIIRRSGSMKQGQYFEQIRTYMSEHIAETKRLNASLERIAAVLEAREGAAKAADRA